MPSAANETVAQDIRNALQLLTVPLSLRNSTNRSEFLRDVHAARARLESALAKLDATTAEERAIGRREHELGIMQDRAEAIAPLDYVQPGQHDAALTGQPIEAPDL